MTTFRIHEMAKPYIDYDMIRIHTELPDFPELRTRLLFAFLGSSGTNADNREVYALATSLVQMGLDTHDMVPITNVAKEKAEARSRQLKVLAGDYFSSRFYQLLAQAGQIEMIRLLSQAVCEVNRMKMNFYNLVKQLKMTAEEYLLQSTSIRSQLFLSFTRGMEGLGQKLWPDILISFTRCELISNELARLDSLQNIRGSWAYWHIMQAGTREDKKILQAEESDLSRTKAILHKYNISSQLYHMLDTQVKSLWEQIRQLDSEKFGEELFKIVEPFASYLNRQKVLLEELQGDLR
ncbi:heptaprenyl diphosphate synthase component 1 [Paenibacillus sp. MBLB4367]|uniref:heptaprenyl diphosphate synthase component 1 n=1 Tax=Paenibacillus sp. MBLB4367 TaxID=3384767 RepID=UPI00390813D6